MSNLKLSNFYVRSGLFSVLSLGGAFFSYALYPVIVRILNAKNFGNFTVVVALSNQLLGILFTFVIISIYLVKSHKEERARQHAQTIQKVLIWLLIACTLILLAFSHYLSHLLKIQNVGYFVILALILLIAIPGNIWTGYLQGNKELVRVGSFNLAAGLSKFILAIVFALWLGTLGGLLGVFAGAIVGLLVIWFIPGKKLPSLRTMFSKIGRKELEFLLSLRKYVLECIIIVGLFSFLQNYDITLAKSLFSPKTAGIYSGISILSNALYYICFLLVWVVLPEFEINNKKANNRILGTTYKLLSLLTVVAIAFELLLRNYLTKILLGPHFGGLGTLLIFATLYQLTLVGITLYVYYLLIMRQRRAALLTFAIVASCAVLPLLFVSTPLAMIRTLWLSLVIGFAIYSLVVRFIGIWKPAHSRILNGSK